MSSFMDSGGSYSNSGTVVSRSLQIREISSCYEGEIKSGLDTLDADFSIKQIARDGHCFFRCVATHLLLKLKTLGAEERIDRLNAIAAVVCSLSSKELSTKFETFKYLYQAIPNRAPVVQVISSALLSNETIVFIRCLAAEYNSKNQGRDFDFMVKASGYTQAVYLSRMKDFSKAEWATDPEIDALSNALELNIKILEPKAFNTGVEEKVAVRTVFKSHEGDHDLYLLHLPGHYELAEKKICI